MYLQIDPHNGNPIYLQIMEQIKHAIAIGVFAVGQSIPTIREMALELRVNPNTVAKAVRELEREGILNTLVGKGSFVTPQAGAIHQQENTEKGQKLANQFVKDMHWLGFTAQTAQPIVNRAWEDLESRKK